MQVGVVCKFGRGVSVWEVRVVEGSKGQELRGRCPPPRPAPPGPAGTATSRPQPAHCPPTPSCRQCRAACRERFPPCRQRPGR